MALFFFIVLLSDVKFTVNAFLGALSLENFVDKNNIKSDLQKVKIRVLTNFNLEFIVDSLFFCFYQRGIFADISYSDFGTMFAELLDPKSQTYTSKPDIIFTLSPIFIPVSTPSPT